MSQETSISFASTKVRPPRFRTGMIERDTLEQRLGEALLERRVVLLVAAAGYGKTVALSRQLSRLPTNHVTAWITADEQDDLPRLLACLIESLEAHDPPWRVAPQSLAERASKAADVQAVAAELTNTLAAMSIDHGVIALDDLHLVTDARIFEFLQTLIEHAPANWTFAIATRTAPPLALARLRARRELAEFGAQELSFTADEVRLLWGHAGQEKDEQTIQSLMERTQGWPAGLCLTLDVLGRHSAPAQGLRLSQRHLFEYLATEVFERMPVDWRLFLMRCSVLPELTAERCAKVSGDPRAGYMLEEIERRGIFVSTLDSGVLTLRLHDLFRDFLEDRLRRERADEIPQLLRRAAEDETDPVRRADMLLRAGASREAEELVFDIAPDLLAQSQGAQVTRLMERFPAEARDSSPRLSYVRGLQALSEVQSAVDSMGKAAAGFEREGDALRLRRALAHQAFNGVFWGFSRPGQVRSLIAATEKNDPEQDLETALANAARRHSEAVLEGPQGEVHRHLSHLTQLLESSRSPALWFRFFPFVSMHFAVPGARPLVRRLASGALAVAADGHLPLQLQAQNTEAWLLLWSGRAAEAQVRIRQLRADVQWAGWPGRSQFDSWLLDIAASGIGGGHGASRMAVRKRHSFDGVSKLELGMMSIAGMMLDDWSLVRRVNSQFEGNAGNYCDSFAPLFKARLALHDGQVPQALALLRECVKTSADIDRAGLDAMVRKSLAIAELRSGEAPAAWCAIEPLVRRVRASGEVLGVLLCGPASLAELARSAWPPDVPGEGLAELRRWALLAQSLREEDAAGEAAVSVTSTESTPGPSPGLSLSVRELEVLTLIAAGDSNKLIARALDLSPHTIKRHVARILERLDLTSRGEAAAWYHRYSSRSTAT